jgi:hypothetical protein
MARSHLLSVAGGLVLWAICPSAYGTILYSPPEPTEIARQGSVRINRRACGRRWVLPLGDGRKLVI